MCSSCDGNEYREVIAENVRAERKREPHPEGCLCVGCSLDDLIVRANQHMQRLNATRDTAAIRASAANTRLLISEITMAQGKP